MGMSAHATLAATLRYHAPRRRGIQPAARTARRSRARVMSASAGESSSTMRGVDPDDGAWLVTGAAGFIGSHVVEHLLRSGAKVIAVDNLDENGPYPVEWKEANLDLLADVAVKTRELGSRLVFARCDARDRERLHGLFQGGDELPTGIDDLDSLDEGDDEPMPAVSRVVHLGARSGVASAASDPEGAVDANVASTAVLLDLAARQHCVSFTLASSGSVYGECHVDQSGEPVASVERDSTSDPISPYAATKRAAELMARAYVSPNGGGMRVTVCRVFTVYGPRGRPDMAVYRFITALQSGDRIFRFGDGNSTWRDYLHVDDVVSGLISAAVRGETAETAGGVDHEPAFAIVNLASGTPTRLGELIDAVARSVGLDEASVGKMVLEKPGRVGDVGGTYADVSAARLLIGWAPEVGLEDGVARTAGWYASEEARGWGGGGGSE